MIELLVMEGDGIGPEICAATLNVLRAVDRRFELKLGFTTAIIPAGTKAENVGMELRAIRDMGDLLSLAGAEKRPSRRGRMES